MNRYQTLLKNIGLFGISSVAVKAITFFLVPLYTFYLTAGEFGITDMFVMLITRFGPILILESQRALLRYGVADSERVKEYSTVAFWLTVFGSICSAALLPILDFPVFGGLGDYKLIFWIAISLNLLQQFFDKIARILNQIRLITWVSISSSVGTLAGAILFLKFLDQGIYGFFYSFILGNCVGCLLYLLLGRYSHLIGSPLNVDLKKPIIRLLKFSLPLLLTTVSWGINNIIASRFIISSLIGISALGLYAAATKIPNLILIITGVIQDAWNLSAFQEYKRTDVTGFFNSFYAIFNSLMLFTSGTLIMISQFLASIVLQKEFFHVWTLIPLLIWASYYGSLYTFYESIYLTKMKTSRLSFSLICGMIVCVVATYYGVRFLGLPGAAFGLLLSNFLIWIIRTFDSQYLIKIDVPVVLTCIQHSLLGLLSLLIYTSEHSDQGIFVLLIYALLIISCVPQLISPVRKLKNYFRARRKIESRPDS